MYQTTIFRVGGGFGVGYRQIQSLNSTLDEGKWAVSRSQCFSPGKKALVLVPMGQKDGTSHINTLRCQTVPGADDFKMLIGWKIVCEPSIHKMKPVKLNTLRGKHNCIYIMHFIWVIMGEWS
jgi:hypothetical protein